VYVLLAFQVSGCSHLLALMWSICPRDVGEFLYHWLSCFFDVVGRGPLCGRLGTTGHMGFVVRCSFFYLPDSAIHRER
jgi:hypothetical protein